jgi:hypothetical protein
MAPAGFQNSPRNDRGTSPRTPQKRWLSRSLAKLLDEKAFFLQACATVAFALREVAEALRTHVKKMPFRRVPTFHLLLSDIPFWLKWAAHKITQLASLNLLAQNASTSLTSDLFPTPLQRGTYPPYQWPRCPYQFPRRGCAVDCPLLVLYAAFVRASEERSRDVGPSFTDQPFH